MKNLIILLTLLGLTFTIGLAQPGEKRGERGENSEQREKIREWRTAYITDKLELSEDESIRFWPIFNERERRLRALKKEKRALHLNNLDNMTDAEAENAIEKHFELRQKELDIHRECFNKLRKVMPAKKLARLPKVEREFKKVILDKMKGRRPPPSERLGGPGGKKRDFHRQ